MHCKETEKKLEDLEKILNSWKRRKLTLLGKIIVRSLGLSKLIYNASVLSLPENFSKRVDKVIFLGCTVTQLKNNLKTIR